MTSVPSMRPTSASPHQDPTLDDQKWAREALRSARDACQQPSSSDTDPFMDHIHKMLEDRAPGNIGRQTKLIHSIASNIYWDVYDSERSRDTSKKRAKKQASVASNDLKTAWKARSAENRPNVRAQNTSDFPAQLSEYETNTEALRPATAPRPLMPTEAPTGSLNNEADNAVSTADRASKNEIPKRQFYGRKTWSGWNPDKSAQPDRNIANYLNARDNFKKATSTHSKILVAVGIFMTGVGGVLVAPLAFSTISDNCKADAKDPTGCRNAKFAAAGAVLVCIAGILTGFSLFVSDQRKQRRKHQYKEFHKGADRV